MLVKYFKNSIISFLLIISMVLTPMAFIPRKAQAESITAVIGGVSGAITQLPLCKNKLAIAFTSLFGGQAELMDKLADEAGDASYQDWLSKVKLEEELQDSEMIDSRMDIDENGIPITIEPSVKSVLTRTLENTKITKEKVASIESNDTCLKSIGRVVIKMLLQKITTSTVEWINNGYSGSPMFIQDPGQFFGDIAKNELLQFGVEINNSENPFGKTWLQNQAMAFNQKFADNARYSLNDLIQQTTPEFSAITFGEDFSQGGWSAWDAMTQYPQNNPLGFNLMASNELQRRLAGTSQSNAQNLRDSLQEASGYLGSEQCVDPERAKNITRDEYNDALKNGKIICNKWEYVTPGQMVATAATSVVNYPENNLLKAEDLNDAVAAILDALLSSFSNNIMSNTGFAGLPNSQIFQQASTGKFVINSANMENYGVQDFSGNQIARSSFLQQNPNFDIRADLNQALIDEQRIFADKLGEQNKELNSTTDGKPYKLKADGTSNAYGLIPTIYQLDYCIPGPHPGWENDTQNNLNDFNNLVPIEVRSIITDPQVFENNSFLLKTRFNKVPKFVSLQEDASGFLSTFGSFTLAIIKMININIEPVGLGVTINIAPLVDLIDSLLASFYNKAMYSAVFKLTTGLTGEDKLISGKSISDEITGSDTEITETGTGIKISINSVIDKLAPVLKSIDSVTTSLFSKISSKSALEATLNYVLDEYITASHNIYNNSAMIDFPADENKVNFKKISGYNKMIENNKTRIVSMNNVIKRLTAIKNNVDALNGKLASGKLNQDGYEEQLKQQIDSFATISSEMVTGDDIALVDNKVKEIIDEKNYIYNVLISIKALNSCEKALTMVDESLAKQNRVEYPSSNPILPILYDYNNSSLFKENGYYIKIGKDKGDGLGLIDLTNILGKLELINTVTANQFEKFFNIY